MGSPWLPVHRTSTRSGGSCEASSGLTIASSGNDDVAEISRDVEVLAHRAADDDDLAAALHPDVGGLLHAVDVRGEGRDEDLSVAQWEDRRNASPTSRSEPVFPGRSAFVESPSRRSTPRFPISASVPTSVFSPSTGVWSSFQSPVCTTRPAAVSITSAAESGIECATRTSSARNGPSSSGASPGGRPSSSAFCASPCSSSFDFTSAEGQRRRDDGLDVHLPQEVRATRRRDPRGHG